MEDSLFGQVLVQSKLVTPGQLAAALEAQSRGGRHKRMLGEVLVEQGVVTAEAIDALVASQLRQVEISKAQSRFGLGDLQSRLKDAKLADYLKVAREMSASELFLTSTQRPAIRIHGHLVDLPAAPMPFEQVKEMLFTALTPAQQADYARAKHVETGLELAGAGRFTAGIFRHFLGIAGVFHVVPDAPWVFERLGLPATARRIAQYSHGLVLITGPLGSGKSATLSAYLEMINREQPLHIITIEHPIEVLYQSDRSLISQREVGRHTASYADALRAALREDPDVIAVGELTDPDSTATALQAAETGHLVFATMTTSNAHRTIVRLLDQFPSHKRAQIRAMLANTLRAVVSQQLVPNLDGRGRSLAYELLFANAAVSNLIREDRIWQIPMVMQVAGPQGMRLMDDSLRELVGARRISLADAVARATDKDRMLPR